MSFPWVAQINYKEAFQTYAASSGRLLGSLAMTPDGSMYRFCRAGAAITNTWGCINANRHLTGVTGESSEAALTVAIAAGDRSFTFADTNTRIKDYFKDGYVVMFPSHIELHRIASSTLGDATSIKCYLEGGDEFVTADALGNTVNVYPSPWGNIRMAGVLAATYEGFVCCPKRPVTSGYYFWGQVTGPYWTTVTSTWPLAAANDLQVVFHQDGSFKMADEAYNGGVSNQIAGHVMVSGNYGDCLIMLQIE
jgi:hypothetical protein